MLLRGVGVRHNDVAVVTNVTEDHLGLHGVDTVDQLAEVKGVITRITRPQGWDVLNADDPRVLAMRRHATGRPWLFSLDPHHPAIREALGDGGPGHDGARRPSRMGRATRDAPARVDRRHPRHARRHLPAEPSERHGGGGRRVGDRTSGARGRQGPEDVRPGSRTQSRAREPVPDRSAHRRDRLRAQRGRHDRPDRGAGRPQDRAAARCGWRSARPATAPTGSSTRSRSARPSVRITWRSPSSCTTSAADPARTSSNGSARARAKPA